jgi:mRNA-degrading endonuclease toxin of MazEF toxin-antitoxin module
VEAEETGLRGRSTVLLKQIQTVDIASLGQRSGLLGPHRMERVEDAIRQRLGLPR